MIILVSFFKLFLCFFFFDNHFDLKSILDLNCRDQYNLISSHENGTHLVIFARWIQGVLIQNMYLKGNFFKVKKMKISEIYILGLGLPWWLRW